MIRAWRWTSPAPPVSRTISCAWCRQRLTTSLRPAPSIAPTGVILCKLSEAYYGQLDLFGEVIRLQRLSNLV